MASEAVVAVKKKTMVAADDRRGSWLFRVLLLAALVATMLLLLVFGRSVGAPAVWVTTSAVASSGEDSSTGCLQRRPAGSNDKLLGGLLADGFDERSCYSRYQSAMYHRNAGRQPFPYLVSKLRRQEALQKRCGPGTAAYSAAVEQLRSGARGGAVGSPECKYLVSISYSGLGNRILAAAAAFLYAMLTDRVLLVDPGYNVADLFCEPFPDTSWLVPPGFPLSGYTNFSDSTAKRWGNAMRNQVSARRTDAAGEVSSSPPPVFTYVHLGHDAAEEDKRFFCDEDQRLLRGVPWVVMRTNNYIVPGLFLVAAFRDELGRLFPEPDAAFHHLGRYLFHPTNHVWGLITRYHAAYLAPARRRVGVQVRVFGGPPNSPLLLEQITACTQRRGLLPEVLSGAEGRRGTVPVPAPPGPESTAVLVTSLNAWYHEKLKSMYWEHAAATGEAVSVHQPSHEEFQQYGARAHDARAWAEIYLLSLTDELVTSAWSTFGYVAQGLGGLRSWVIYTPPNETRLPDPPCSQDVSMDPCYHFPPLKDCRSNRRTDTGKIMPQIQNCIDVSWGLKLVQAN
ncbi:hypothetical protein ACP4OV_001375 [Aristida adscensionis]